MERYMMNRYILMRYHALFCIVCILLLFAGCTEKKETGMAGQDTAIGQAESVIGKLQTDGNIGIIVNSVAYLTRLPEQFIITTREITPQMYTYAFMDVNNSSVSTGAIGPLPNGSRYLYINATFDNIGSSNLSELGFKSFKENPLVIGNGWKYPATEWDLHGMNITVLSENEKSTSYTCRLQKGSTVATVFVLPQNVTAERLEIPYLWNDMTENLVVNLT